MKRSDRRISQRPSWLGQVARGEVILLAGLFVMAALILTFGHLAEEVMEGDTTAFDTRVIMAFRTPGHPEDIIGPPWLEEMGRDVTALGSYAFLGFVLIAVTGYLLLIRKRAAAALMAVSVLGGVALSNLLKIGFDRPRPDLIHSARVFTASFPSGHATLSESVWDHSVNWRRFVLRSIFFLEAGDVDAGEPRPV